MFYLLARPDTRPTDRTQTRHYNFKPPKPVLFQTTGRSLSEKNLMLIGELVNNLNSSFVINKEDDINTQELILTKSYARSYNFLFENLDEKFLHFCQRSYMEI